MHEKVACVHVDHTISEASVRMDSEGVGWLLVVDGDEVVGVVTDRDIAVRAVAGRYDCKKTKINIAMSTPIAFSRETDTIESAARIMVLEKIRRLAVVNPENACVGVLSLGDISKYCDGTKNDADLRVLKSISRPSTLSKAWRVDRVGYGRSTLGRLGAPPDYMSAPRIPAKRSANDPG